MATPLENCCWRGGEWLKSQNFFSVPSLDLWLHTTIVESDNQISLRPQQAISQLFTKTEFGSPLPIVATQLLCKSDFKILYFIIFKHV